MRITKKVAKDIMDHFKINPEVISVKTFMDGMKEEAEHEDITKGDLILTAKIVIAHLNEHPQYYKYLKRMVKKLKKLPTENIYIE